MPLRPQDLASKVALITGGTRGIGRATALHLASRGCSILITCSRPESLVNIASLQGKVDQLFSPSSDDDHNASPSTTPTPTSTPTVIGIVASIYSPTTPTEICTALAKHFASRIDIVVLNAAASYATFVGQLDEREVCDSLFANVQNNAFVVDELVRTQMFQPESRIVFVSSVRDRMPWRGQLIYSAGKAAGESLCRTWGESFGGKYEEFAFMAGTTANSVLVGLTSTDAVNDMPGEFLEGAKNEFIPQQTLPRYGQAEDVADVIGMLCGRDARWVSGSTVSACGGCVKIQ